MGPCTMVIIMNKSAKRNTPVSRRGCHAAIMSGVSRSLAGAARAIRPLAPFAAGHRRQSPCRDQGCRRSAGGEGTFSRNWHIAAHGNSRGMRRHNSWRYCTIFAGDQDARPENGVMHPDRAWRRLTADGGGRNRPPNNYKFAIKTVQSAAGVNVRRP